MDTGHGDPARLASRRSLDAASREINRCRRFARLVRGQRAALTGAGGRVQSHRARRMHCDFGIVSGSGEAAMFDYRDLFQWERFITPSIIKVFYWLAVAVSVLIGLSGILSGLLYIAVNPMSGLVWIVGSAIGVLIGVLFARIMAEFVLIMFRINEHLGAIRNRGQM
jgi:hypothetical protein